VETLKYFKHMLFGHKIIIKTDHNYLTHQVSAHASDRVLWQRLLLEEYGAEIQYIAGEKNIAADALSRLPTEEIFLFEAENEFPLNLDNLASKQLTDDYLQLALEKKCPEYTVSLREGRQLYVHSTSNTIYVPFSLRPALLQWYHTSLQHPGIKRMQATVKESFYWPSIDAAIDKVIRTCDICQKCKITAVKKYGKIPLPKHTNLAPWKNSR